MTGLEFTEMVGWIQDRWGTGDQVWANADRFASDFADLDADDVWAAVYAKGTGQWAPRPPELVAAAREQMRDRLRPERQPMLDAPKGANWAEWCMEKFGQVRAFEDVVRERHAQTGGCLSPSCDVHRGTG